MYDLDALYAEFPSENVEKCDDYYLSKPDPKLYRDLNSSHSLNINNINFDKKYFSSIQASVNNNKGKIMYDDNFLLSLTKAVNDKNEIFLSAGVASHYRKSVIYHIDMKITNYGWISDTQCECPSGKGPTAHCKHICVVFEAIKDFIKNKTIKIRLVCTEKLQTFHQPKRLYTGSPVKAVNLDLCRLDKLDAKLNDFDPRPAKRRKMLSYNSNFRNQCINFAATTLETFPELQLFAPANLYAVYNDHNYFEKCVGDLFLKSMNVTTISTEKIIEIESLTRGQSGNTHWIQERSIRMTSSCFGDICTAKTPEKYVNSLMNPRDISHLPAIKHGKKYEPHAIKLFEAHFKIKIQDCGLFVSPTKPYLAASPDGVLSASDLVEVNKSAKSIF